MINLTGKYTEATIYTDNCEAEAQGQIIAICNHPLFEDNPVKMMPDVHFGKGCCIGFTAKLTDGIIPNLIGVDIGCGMRVDFLEVKQPIDLPKLDNFIRRNIPHGFNGHDKIPGHVRLNKNFINNVEEVCKMIGDDKSIDDLKKVGSLGGGNHFIEVNGTPEEPILVIHTGSRNFGNRIAKFYQQKAIANNNHFNKELCWITGQDEQDYMFCIQVAQRYAELSRLIISLDIVLHLQKQGAMDTFVEENSFESVHNYLDFNKGYLRKGAISAQAEEQLIIPLNMRDGCILATGKGNPDWNYSAPHGAGRLKSRGKAKKELSLENFTKQMEGIYTSSVAQSTLDESPDAYKPAEEILSLIEDTVENIVVVKPIYNFKAP